MEILLNGTCNTISRQREKCGVSPIKVFRSSPYTYISYGDHPTDSVTTGLWNMNSIDVPGMYRIQFRRTRASYGV